ncbi:glycosyltransferase [Bacterioplanoides sp.]|uniref:glycosyltransferase n=1 Tax=Bacterioplanoides sp. TaxID=2066072 RepID=UPI003B5B704D
MLDLTAIIPTVGRFDEVNKLCLGLVSYNIKCIVVVDGPFEDPKGVLSDIKKSADIIYLERNVGQALATDKGIDIVDTNKIMLIDSDDFITIDDVKRFEKELDGIQSKQILLPRSIAISGGRVIKRTSSISSYSGKLRKNTFGAQSGVIFNREDYVSLGGQSKKLASCKDWDMWIRALENGFFFHVYNADVFYSKSDDGISRNLANVLKGRFQLWEAHPLLFTSFGRLYDWYLLLRYVAFNCEPAGHVNFSMLYNVFYPIHRIVFKLRKRFF